MNYYLVKINIWRRIMDNRYNRHNRRKYSLKVHIVLVTKYRPPPYKSTLKAKVNG